MYWKLGFGLIESVRKRSTAVTLHDCAPRAAAAAAATLVYSLRLLQGPSSTRRRRRAERPSKKSRPSQKLARNSSYWGNDYMKMWKPRFLQKQQQKVEIFFSIMIARRNQAARKVGIAASGSSNKAKSPTTCVDKAAKKRGLLLCLVCVCVCTRYEVHGVGPVLC